MSLRDQLCDMREYLVKRKDVKGSGPIECASALRTALEHYSSVGQQILNNAQSTWSTTWPRDLPIDLSELLQRRHFTTFEPADINDAYLIQMVGKWHTTLFNAINGFCKEDIRRKVLCGFNVVNDLIFYLGSDKDLDHLWGAWGSPPRGKFDKKPQNMSDALACLIEILNDPSRQGKFNPNSGTFGQILQKACQAGLDCDRFVGGAAANNAYVLGHMGVEVHLHCLYHSDSLNWSEMASTMQYLKFDGSHSKAPINPGAPDLPIKTTVGFQSFPRWDFPQLSVQVNEPGRSLFIGRDPVFSPRPWQDVRIIWGKRGKQWKNRWQNPEVWPYPAVFGNHTIQGQTLEIRPLDGVPITQWAKQEAYDVALLKDVGYRPDDSTLEKARKKQLDALRAAGVPIHLEVSPGFKFAFLRYLIGRSSQASASTGWSASLNPDELLEITAEGKGASDYRNIRIDPYLFPSRQAQEGLVQRFARAHHLLRLLNFDWIYVHGNELDITIWRPEACRKIANFGQKIRDAMLLAKAAVVAAMIERTPHPQLRQYVTNQLQQGSALAVKGFWALIAFAQEFSEWAAARYSLRKEAVHNALLEKGFYELDEFGVAVAPVFWPNAVQNLNATGAGDYSSAVVAAYVWK